MSTRAIIGIQNNSRTYRLLCVLDKCIAVCHFKFAKNRLIFSFAKINKKKRGNIDGNNTVKSKTV